MDAFNFPNLLKCSNEICVKTICLSISCSNSTYSKSHFKKNKQQQQKTPPFLQTWRMRCRLSIVTEGARVLSAQMCHRLLLWTCTSHLAMGDGFSQPEHRIHNKLLQYRNSFKKHLVSEPTSEIQFPSLFSILGMKCSDAALQQHQTRTPLVSTELSITAGNAPLLWKGMLPVWEQYALGQGQPSAAWLSKDESTSLLIVFFSPLSFIIFPVTKR